MISPAMAGLIQNLINVGAQLYANSQDHLDAQDIEAFGKIVPRILSISNTMQKVSDVLKQAQSEDWTETDDRWIPIFEESDKALEAALERLT